MTDRSASNWRGKGPLDGCRIRIATSDSGREATEEVYCWSDDGTDRNSPSEVTLEQVTELRRLLKRARLFEGQFWGGFEGGIVSDLITLQVVDGDRVAKLVCSGNPTFHKGGRLELVKWLGQRMKGAKEGEGDGPRPK